MKCIETLNDLKLNNTAVTIGKFDGLHKGHAKLIDVLKTEAENRETVVLTFAAKPIDVINHAKSNTIVTEEEKRLLCEKKQIDYYVTLPLSQEFLDLSPEAFIKNILVDMLDMTLIVCGPDFTFGRFGSGNTELLKKMGKYYGYDVIVVEKEQYNNHDIGSTGIREKIREAKIKEANDMLGHPFSVIGKVTQGKQLGRKMNLPTANIIPDKNKILPPNGVYRTKLICRQQTYNAITNIGINPTVEDGHQIKVETHILDGNPDLYNEIIEVQFYDFIREERKFDGIEQLQAQILSDIEKIKQDID